ncbi:hypothetical protein [Streptomyces cyaneofuscatus]|uniref:hypothetical protein n=1 Tax=Streptomyces cyaneofuscatus TaxID=66883 RepID=UPI00339EC85E
MSTSPSKLLQRLRREERYSVLGYVRAPEEGEDHLLFSYGVADSGSGWVAVPIDRVDSVEPLSSGPYTGRSQRARLIFKEPVTEEGRVFAALAALGPSVPHLSQASGEARLPLPAAGQALLKARSGDCQQYAGAAEYNWIMMGYHMYRNETAIAIDYYHAYQHAQSLYNHCMQEA